MYNGTSHCVCMNGRERWKAPQLLWNELPAIAVQLGRMALPRCWSVRSTCVVPDTMYTSTTCCYDVHTAMMGGNRLLVDRQKGGQTASEESLQAIVWLHVPGYPCVLKTHSSWNILCYGAEIQLFQTHNYLWVVGHFSGYLENL